MELAQELINIQVEKEMKRAEERSQTFQTKHFPTDGNVIVSFNGVRIGELQPLTVSRLDEPNQNRRTYSLDRTEGTITLQDAQIDLSFFDMMGVDSRQIEERRQQELNQERQESLQQIRDDLFNQMQEMTVEYYSVFSVQPGRAERRKEQFKPRQKRDEELQNDYRKGVRNMLGGRKSWN